MTNSDMIEELKKEGLFLPNGRFNPSYVKKFKNSITPERKEWYDSCLGDSLSEKVYIITNNFSIKPVCPICGTSLKFIPMGEGYREFCSSKCRAEGTKERIEKTNIEKYGTKSPAQSKQVQDKMRATTLERHGVENVFQKKEKIKQIIKDKYGVDHVMDIPGIKEKIKRTVRTKHGVDYPMQSPSIVKKVQATNIEKYGNVCSIHGKEVYKKVISKKINKFYNNVILSGKLSSVVSPLFAESEYKGNNDSNNFPIYYPWECNKCANSFEDTISNGKIPKCPHCYPPGIQGTMEKELVEWIKTIVPNTKIVLNSRRIVSPLEIGIYLPEYNLAIEFDEIYWHCEGTSGGKRNYDYHLSKTEKCKQQGITLIHVLDSEWWNNPEIVKSIILSKLGLYATKIGARKCEVKELSVDQSREFLDNNHIQGYAPASFRFGLFYNGELVAHLAISKKQV